MAQHSNLQEEAGKVIGKEKVANPVTHQQAPIINQEAYDEWVRLRAHPLLTSKKMVKLSDGGEISLGCLPNQLQARIYDLPETEQNKIKSLKRAYTQTIVKANALQRRAYGTMVRGEGQVSPSSRSFEPLDLKRAELLELFGRMFTIPEVHAICLKDWKINRTKAQLEEWRQDNIQEISAKIEEHKRNFSDIRLGYKRSRLEELSWLFNQRKTIYNITKKPEDHRLLLDTLKAIKAEAEGDLIRIEGAVEMNLDNMMHEHLGTEVFRYFPLQEIILARVAAKMGLNVAAMLATLEKGYYHNVLHVDPNEANHQQSVGFPSTLTYDFDRISRMWKQEQERKALQPKIEAAPNPAIQTQGSDLKSLLLAKLSGKVGDVNAARNSQAGYFVDKANK